ncbi:MAG: sensor histidine kinase [Tsuneonella sp.]
MPDRRALARTTLLRFQGNRPVLLLLTASAGLLLIALWAAVALIGRVTSTNNEVEHTLRAKTVLTSVLLYNERIETARRGFLISADPSFLRNVRQSEASLANGVSEVEDLLADNPFQTRRAEAIRQLAAKRSEVIGDNVLTPGIDALALREEGFDAEQGVQLTRRIRALGNEMIGEEDRLLIARNREQVTSLGRFYLVGGTAVALLIVMLVAVIVLVLRYNRELPRAQSELRSANEGLEESVAARTAELLRANQEIQRFAYIVSHDLRSPLVNVLGFTAELDAARKTIRAYLEKLFADDPAARDEATWVAVDEDLPEALGFIRSSTEKMDRLINSILELSRQGRRTLAPEPLDMDALVEGVVASLHRRAEDAGASVIVKSVPNLESDRLAVEQILSNLVENALKYLSPARAGEVTVSGSREGPLVHIDVIDNGRGIAPEDHERVFELFRRAGTQDQPGEGLGLANVRALAYRLGGTVSLESELDRGARFRLSLPARYVATEARA